MLLTVENSHYEMQEASNNDHHQLQPCIADTAVGRSAYNAHIISVHAIFIR